MIKKINCRTWKEFKSGYGAEGKPAVMVFMDSDHRRYEKVIMRLFRATEIAIEVPILVADPVLMKTVARQYKIFPGTISILYLIGTKEKQRFVIRGQSDLDDAIDDIEDLIEDYDDDLDEDDEDDDDEDDDDWDD